jgi:hypothetical protein
MRCKHKPCEKNLNKIKNTGENIEWSNYPSPEKSGFGKGKFCCFISCPDSELPIRDYIYEKKREPCYEEKSYNCYASCNQKGIKNARKRGISYIIFYTRYHGKKESYKNKYFITGLFRISAMKKVNTRSAYRSDAPIFLSIEDSIELNDKIWRKWFKNDLPNNLRYMAKFVEKDSIAMRDILNHFNNMKNKNKIDDYINEITRKIK